MDMTDTAASPTPPGTLPRGTLIAGRFTLEALAGRGGMGTVYRATDRHTGRPVALKLMHGLSSPEATYRFNREAVLLAELRHPAIVSYVAHGVADMGWPFLAMEWLEGEDLAKALAHKPLSLHETLALLRRAAEALASAHRQGIVHRDIKPSNLFLRTRRPEDVVVLDFGLARYVGPTLVGVTQSNMVLGTPGYMAPEQASSQTDITSSADIFSLGCVLYECLTGKPPFAASHPAAALAKILFAQPPPLSTARTGLPPGLQVLVDRMLAKEPRRRLPDATSLLEALSALESVPDLLPRSPRDTPPLGLTSVGQQLVSVLLVSLPAPMEDSGQEAPGLVLREAVRAELSPYGAQVELLVEGTLVAPLLLERGTATDQAALAAHAALTLKERWPDARVVLVTGRSVLSERLPVGEAMDRAGQLLRHLEQVPTPSPVVLDEVTAGLLGPGFQLTRPEAGIFLLHGEQRSMDASRPLLGKPTSCVGREQELVMLELAFNTCVEESTAQAFLVMAPAGVGKSRLRHEFLRRLEQRGQPMLVLEGRADPLTASSAYGLLGQAVRGLCGIQGGEALETRREQLSQRIARHLPAPQRQEVAEFLGELCGIPFPAENSPRLHAARSDPRLLNTQLSRALVTFLQAESQHGAVLLVLEDLHWCDRPSVRLVDEVLHQLAESPLLVLALARPEVKQSFPGLWAGRMQELTLRGLSRKACTQLIREVMGQDVPDTLVGRIIEQSSGNALFMEELIRMVAEGRGEAPPETVLAILQTRLLRLEPGERQVLLAASFFGRTFWSGGVHAVLGPQVSREELEHRLQRLVDLEVIEPQRNSRFPAEAEYRFRHALVRDAAQALVSEDARPVGHRLAGAWLEQAGETDALVLAEHFHRSQQPERAWHFYARAAEHLFLRGDMEGTVRCAEAAEACGASGETLAGLRVLQASVAFLMFDFPKLYALGIPVLPLLKAGSLSWCRLMECLVAASTFLSEPARTAALNQELLRTTPAPDAVRIYIEGVGLLLYSSLLQGARQQMEACTRRLMEVGAPLMASDGMVRGWVRYARSLSAHHYEERPTQALELAEQSLQAFREADMERSTIGPITTSGLIRASLGDMHGALELLQEALASGLRTRQQFPIAYAQLVLSLLLSGSPDPAQRQKAREASLAWARSEKVSLLWKGVAHTVLAREAAGRGELAEAELYGRKACELLVTFPLFLLVARTTLSTTLRAQGRIAESREEAALGVAALERMGGAAEHAVAVHLTLAEACFAAGDAPAAEEALRHALRRLHARADSLSSPTLRERFLRQVPENARVLELARQRWGES
jgi:tetratricopeptide (TPR) repeat protein